MKVVIDKDFAKTYFIRTPDGYDKKNDIIEITDAFWKDYQEVCNRYYNMQDKVEELHGGKVVV